MTIVVPVATPASRARWLIAENYKSDAALRAAMLNELYRKVLGKPRLRRGARKRVNDLLERCSRGSAFSDLVVWEVSAPRVREQLGGLQ